MAVFNQIAAGYDSPALRFFPFAADRLIQRLQPRASDKVLDVAAGTGAATLAAAQAVGASGRVMAVDIAEGMLERLQGKLDKFGIANVDLHLMDAAALEFRRDYFHHVISAFGLFFLPDMVAALQQWVRVTRPGGTVMFTSFARGAFEPMAQSLYERLIEYGAVPPGEPRSFAFDRLADAEVGRRLMQAAGLTEIDVASEQLGYHLRDANDWWEIVSFSGLDCSVGSLLARLPESARESFKAAHLAEVTRLRNDKGIWLNVETLFVCGRKPA
jgi:ubiquinone/menaquinone biosynthesis C-methylase UbiE